MNELVPGGPASAGTFDASARPLALPMAGGPSIPASGFGVAEDASQSALLDDLVDAVVARIEHKVIDELERRGQRHGWTAF